ncbi:cytochrome P450 [Hydrocarboniphaga sp.]|uniref:cytochrome P450 n=1 Tax=Hydrocarboniphaga sp. TaxID=2033016 RepID=UPI003D0A6B1D
MNPVPAPLTLADPQVFQCPYPLYERLRAEAPVYLDPVIGLYLVTGAAEMKEVLHNHVDYSSVPDTRIMAFYSNAPEILELYEKHGGWAPMSTLVTSDPPEHRRYRALVEKAVGASNVRQLRESVTKIINELIDDFIDEPKVDLQKMVSLRLPVFVIGDMLGMPRELKDTLQAMPEATTQLADASLLSPQQIVEGHLTLIRGQKVFHEYIERYRAAPENNLLSNLVHARLDTGEFLSEREIHSVIQALLVGGNDTTPGAIGNSMVILARDAALQQKLRANPSLIANFAEESMRLESPVQGLFRRTTRQMVLGGVTIPEGATLAMRYAAANRDEKVFEHPTELDLERKGIRNHFAFGGGIHYCVGNILARMELTVAVEELLRRMDNIVMDPPDFNVTYLPKIVVRNPESIPVTFTKRV